MNITLNDIYNYKVQQVNTLKNKKSQKQLEKEITLETKPRGFINRINSNLKKKKTLSDRRN